MDQNLANIRGEVGCKPILNFDTVHWEEYAWILMDQPPLLQPSEHPTPPHIGNINSISIYPPDLGS